MAKEWTKEETEILRKYYRHKGPTKLAKQLNRTIYSVKMRAARLGLHRIHTRPWKEWEDRYLQRHSGDRYVASMARTLKRTVPSIVARRKKLGIGDSFSYWKEDEIKVLESMYPDRKNSIEKIAEVLNRSVISVKLKAFLLKLHRPYPKHRWTKEEKKYFLKYRKTKTYKEIGKDLGLPEDSVSSFASRFKILKTNRAPDWTPEDKEFLRENYGKLSVKEIAQRLNRTVVSIHIIAGRMELSRKRNPNWGKEEIEFLRENFKTLPLNKIAGELNRSVRAVRSKAALLKIFRRKPASKKQK